MALQSSIRFIYECNANYLYLLVLDFIAGLYPRTASLRNQLRQRSTGPCNKAAGATGLGPHGPTGFNVKSTNYIEHLKLYWLIGIMQIIVIAAMGSVITI